jgi:GDP/UDP-N,N'-diacetylbacillosamine 2-epimerase (hydrolysing)
MKSKVLVITGSRAEYGLLKSLIKEIRHDSYFELSILATGSHLSPEFGLTKQEIINDGNKIHHEVEMLLSSDSKASVAKSMGLGLIGFSDVFKKFQPDAVIVLGDRYEIFSACAAALVFEIPIIHIHGGEVTEGSLDDAFRHSITKMANLHFVATKEYRNRVIQLGENPDSVINVGGLGVDAINRTELLSRDQLTKNLNLDFKDFSVLVTYHPSIGEDISDSQQIEELLNAMAKLSDTTIIFTLPNADQGGRAYAERIKEFTASNPNSYYFSSLGQTNYLSVMSQVDIVIGNSSSGLLEAPTFKKPTVNIGRRQNGRLTAESVINCLPKSKDILHSIKLAKSDEFLSKLSSVKNPYGEGGSAKKIISILKKNKAKKILSVKKRFFDLSV